MPLNLSDNGQTMDQMLCILRADAASFLDQLRLMQYARKRKEPYIRSMPSGKKGWAMRQTGCRTTHRYTSLL